MIYRKHPELAVIMRLKLGGESHGLNDLRRICDKISVRYFDSFGNSRCAIYMIRPNQPVVATLG